MGKFSASIKDFAEHSKQAMDAVVKQSVQDVVNEANTPIAKGGRMHVDTGFLRASGQMSLTGMPSGPGRGEPNGSYATDDASVITSLANVNIGRDTIFYGWIANYARFREYKDAFLRSAAQRWQTIVSNNARKVKR